jgi:hypothetical protein
VYRRPAFAVALVALYGFGFGFGFVFALDVVRNHSLFRFLFLSVFFFFSVYALSLSRNAVVGAPPRSFPGSKKRVGVVVLGRSHDPSRVLIAGFLLRLFDRLP